MLDEMMDLEGFHERQKENFTPGEQEKMLKEAIDAAKRAEVVVMALGEDRLQSGEATSNANIQIPKVQQVLLEEVSKANENVIVVLFFRPSSGYPKYCAESKGYSAGMAAGNRRSQGDCGCAFWGI